MLQNVGITMSAASTISAFTLKSSLVALSVSVVLTIFVGSASSVGALGASLSVEREWTKTLHHSDPAKLAKLNAGACNDQPLPPDCHSIV